MFEFELIDCTCMSSTQADIVIAVGTACVQYIASCSYIIVRHENRLVDGTSHPVNYLCSSLFTKSTECFELS